MKKIILAGGSGFLGRSLAAHFQRNGYEIIILARNPKAGKAGIREVAWDACTPGEWMRELEQAVAVINLVGRSVNCRYHAQNRRLILESRLASTRVIGEAIARCQVPPPVWLNASTATIYKHTYGPAWDEAGETGGTPEAKDGFSVEVALAWERVLAEAPTPRTRKVALRAAMVLGRDPNSVFPVLNRLARFGLGGKMGDGRQFVSWIHKMDFCRAIEWLVTHEDLSGPVNVCAPQPATNAAMMKIFREACGVPFGLPANRWMLEVGAFLLQTETELLIKSRRVQPRKLMESGFTFRFPDLRGALVHLKTKPRCE